MLEKPKLSVGEYFSKKDQNFYIPSYQRSYKWGLPRGQYASDVEILLEDVYDAFKAGKEEYFIQGITAYNESRGEGEKLVIIDGQQRTITLFLLLYVAQQKNRAYSSFLRTTEDCKIDYAVRPSTKQLLNDLSLNREIPEENFEKTQEGSIIRKAILGIGRFLNRFENDQEELSAYIRYVINNIKLFLITIEPESAEKVFALMNGAKAMMTTDELVKSDFLSKASQDESESRNESNTIDDILLTLRNQIAMNWDNTAVRSRMARQWDKWLYWWADEERRLFFEIDSQDKSPMGWLIPLYCKVYSPNKIYYSNDTDSSRESLTGFQKEFLKDKQSAKLNFDKLRRLQKGLEDLYNDTVLYNYLGFGFTLTGKDHYLDLLQYFVENRKDKSLIRKFLIKLLLGYKFEESKKPVDKELKEDNPIDETRSNLFDPQVYLHNKELLFKWLLFRNIDNSITDGKRFNFVYQNKKKNQKELMTHHRSVEHIWPKSRVIFEKDNIQYTGNENKDGDGNGVPYNGNSDGITRIFRKDLGDYTEHSIGNLVLLHNVDNSKFRAQDPEKKKEILFNVSDEKQIFSRGLLHTLNAFGKNHWDSETKDPTQKMLNIFRKRRSEEETFFNKIVAEI